MIKDYYQLAKPGIVYGNVLVAAAAYTYAAQAFQLVPFAALVLGLAGIVASACTINNYLDRDIDARMERTKERASVNGRIVTRDALVFALILLVLGSVLLAWYTNLLTLCIGLAGFIVYVALYTPLKRRSAHAVLVGALAGAVPPVAGYTAAANTLDTTALVFFILLISWQMVHFCAIALYREDEYRTAGVPVFPIRHGHRSTWAMMTAHALVFLLCIAVLGLIGHFNRVLLAVLGLLAVVWLGLCLYRRRAKDERAWARIVFFYSLVLLLAWCAVLVLS